MFLENKIKRKELLIIISLFLAFEIFDEKRPTTSPSTVARTTKTDLPTSDIRSKTTNNLQDESSIMEEASIHEKDTEL